MLNRKRLFLLLSIMLLFLSVSVGCNRTKESVKKTAEVTKAETDKNNTTTAKKQELSDETTNEQQTTDETTDEQQQTSDETANETEQPQTSEVTESLTSQSTQSAVAPTPAAQPQTLVPTQSQTQAPTQAPTQTPTQAPTQPSTQAPTQAPTQPSTQAPTQAPTQPSTQAPTQSSAASDFSKEAAMESLNLQNQKRAEAGLAPLSWNEELYQDIMVRGKEIKEVFSHDRPDGSSCFSVVTVDWHTIGENIAFGYQSAQAVTEGWYNSQGHRENMLNGNFTSAAVVCYQGVYWVTMFIG